ncbi:placenta-specific protein 9-like isoform X2 [Pristis pectinata]|uniref:placenta-specific protein 9-like isoform X2 n=1 Tax=Pristis pectinata TaxID=685728 RepID=UPI00223D1C13|nr:placenta-specific protein 9-like isoform X2 [Pristis pectinata]
MRALCALAGILLIFGPTRAVLDLQRDNTNWCEYDKALHTRLNIVEKNIEQTVNHLEAEVSDLLRFIETSNISLQLGSPTIDIFEGLV